MIRAQKATAYALKKVKGMLRVAIVEDDPKDAALLKKYIKDFAAEQSSEIMISQYGDPISFLDKYDASFDIVFMDIELPDMDGLKASGLLRKLDEKVMLIFVTNMAQFAVKGYEVDAFDFVVKPVKYYDFRVRFSRAISRLSRRRDYCFGFKARDGSMHSLETSSVKYIEVINHSLLFHTDKGSIEASGRLDDFEKHLADHGFFRCNRCYLVNMKYVTAVKDDEVVIGGKNLKISRPRRKEFLKAFAERYGGG